MVAIFTGLGAGFERGSAAALGSGGLLGSSSLGRGGEGVFLNAYSGNLILSRQDEFLLGRGPDASITRTYNSQGALDDNGDFWRQSTDRRVVGTATTIGQANSTFTRVAADGSETIYRFVQQSGSNSIYETTEGSGSYDRLIHNGSTWTWYDGDSDISEAYAAYGTNNWRITSQSDADGNALSFTYSSDKLWKITTQKNGSTEVGYIEYLWTGNNLTSVKTWYDDLATAPTTLLSQTLVTYGYDGSNRLTSVTVDLTPANASDSVSYVTTYGYSGTSNRVTSITQTDGSSLVIAYDGSFRVTSLTETAASGNTRVTSISYTNEGNGLQRTEVTDPRGQVTKLWTKLSDDGGTTWTDEQAQLVRVMAPPATTGGTPTEINYIYDAKGNVVAAEAKSGTTVLGTTSYLYDSRGNLITTTDPTGRSVQRTYANVNNTNLLVRESDGTGESILQGASALTSSSAGSPGSASALNGMWTVSNGVAQASLPSTGDFHGIGPKEVIALVTGQTYHLSVEFKVEGPYSYNSSLGAPIIFGARMLDSSYALARHTGVSATATDLGAGWVRLEFDITAQSGEAFIRPFVYRRESLTGTGTIAFRNLRVDNETRYVYDSPGNNLRFAVSPEGHVTENIYSGGLLKYAIAYTNDAYIVNTGTPLTESALATWSASHRAGAAKVTEYVYNVRGALTQKLTYGVADASTLSTDLYNAVAPAAYKVEGYSGVFYVYDQSGRLLSTYDTSGSTSVQKTYVYDGLGRLTGSTDGAGGATTNVFNDAATTTTVTTQTSGGAQTGQSYVVVSTYNKAGDLVSVVDSGSATGGVFTAGGTETKVYDKNGRLRLVTDATGRRHFYLYDKAGRTVAEVWSDSSGSATGAIVEYRYDALGRVVATAHYTNMLTTAQLDTLADPANEVDLGTTNSATMIARPAAHSYDIWQWSIYDDAGRVIETILGDGSVTQYVYDNAGRLVKTTGFYNKLSSTTISGYITTPPTSTAWPTADASNDVVLRTFYDRDGRVIGTLNGEGYLTETVYDNAGQKVQEIAYATATVPTDRASGSFATLKTSLADAARDISVRYIHDGQGLLRFTIDALNRVTETVYYGSMAGNAIGLSRRTVTYNAPLSTPPANYNYATVKTAVAALASAQNDKQAWSIYNTRGQLVYAVSQIQSTDVSGVYHPIGTVMRFDYDLAGNVIKTTQYATTIDMHGRSVDATGEYDTWAAANGSNARITRNYYAERGELRYSIDAEGYVTQNVYDAEARLTDVYRFATAITVSDATTILDVYNANKGSSVRTQHGYDYAGRQVTTVNANGVQSYYGYYANGMQAWGIRAHAQSGTDDDARIQYIYNQAGRLVREICYTSDAGWVSSLGTNATLVNQAQRLISANTQYSAVLSREGELRIYYKGEAIWSNGVSESISNATYRLVAQTDGNLVVYRDVSGQSSVAIWTSGSSYAGATYLKMQDTGNLELRKGTAGADLGLVWSTGTSGVTGSSYATEWVDANYTYDGLGNLATVTDGKGQVTTNTYDRVGRLKTTSKNSVTTSFDYDAFGHGVKATDASGNASYSYYDQAGRVVLTVDTESYAVRTAYNAFNEVVSVTRYYNKATGTGNLTTQPAITADAAKDAVTTFAYDRLGRLASKTGPEGGVESYSYNAFGQKLTVTNALGGVTAYAYNARGLVISETLPVGAYNAAGTLVTANVVNTFAYDSRGNRTQMVEASGLSEARTTNYEYDAINRLTRVYHEALSVTNSAGATSTITPETRTIYDRRDNVIETIDAAGGRTLFWYDDLDRVTHQLSATGTLTRFFYDKNTNVAETRVYDTSLALPADAKSLAPAGTGAYRVTRYTYDALDRLVETRVPSIDAAAISGGTLTVTTQDLVTTSEYNAVGNVVKTVDPNGKATWFYYDKAGNLTTRVNAANVRTDMTYDAGGNVLTEKTYYNASATPTGTTTPPATPTAHAKDRVATFVYDKAGRRTVSVDGEGYAVATTYNGLNQIVTVTRHAVVVSWSGGQPAVVTNVGDAVTTLTYDFLGRVTNSADALNVSEAYKLNGHGEQVRVTNRLGGATTYTYDKLGRIITETLPVGAYNAAGTQVAANIVNTYQYDATGNRTRMIEASGLAEARTTNYEYDAGNRLLRTYGASTAVYASSTAASSTNVTPEDRSIYNSHGEVIEKIDAAGARTLFWYNPAGQLTHQLTQQAASTGTLSRFFYDKSGNTLETRVYETLVTLPANANGTAPAGTGVYRLTRHVYDNLNRATETRVPAIETAIYSGGALTVASTDLVTTSEYDALGNLVKTTDPNSKATWFYYNKAGRQTTKIDAENYRTDWTYDADGNVLSERRYATASATPTNTTTPPSAPATTADDRVTTFTYDKLGQRITETRLSVKVHNGSGGEIVQNSTITYAYNGLGQVLSKTEAPALPAAIPWWNHTSGQTLQLTYGQTVQGENALLLRREVPITDPSWIGWQHGGTIVLKGGDRADGFYTVQAGQTVRYTFETTELSDAAMRTDALLEFWDAAGNYLGGSGATYTENTSQFTLASASAVAPTGAAYATLQIGLVRLNTTNSGPMEIAIRNINLDNSGVTPGSTTLGRTNGDSVKYVYDLGGRLTTELRSGFIDVNGQWVTPTVDYYYNGLDDLSRTRQRGTSGTIAAAERVTTYTYGTGGRLATMTDASGFARTYRYDAAGRVVREEYTRAVTSTVNATEAIGTDYDIAGRTVTTGVMTWTGSVWTRSGLDYVSTQYNAFGEVSARGLNGVLAETNAYDAAGRMWRTTAGDGTWKYFMYDKAGNQTLAIASDGTDISSQTMTWVLDRWGSNRALIATDYVDGVVATITRYDGRNMALEVREPQRELNATTRQNLTTTRAYNAFGETKYEINASGSQVDYTYNTMGRLIKTESPTVSVTSETGAVSNVRPTEYRYYDLSGRLVASKDANGNLTRLTLLAGTGFGGSEALVTQTQTADNATIVTAYDIHGDARRITDQISRVTNQTFDAMGRITQVTRPGGLAETFEYDGLGQTLRRYNNLLGSTYAETTTYDGQGRVTQQVAPGGDVTTNTYQWLSSITTAGLGDSDGWRQTTTHHNGKTLIVDTDQFGREVVKTDLGGNTSASTYDKAGRLVLQDGGINLNLTYFNTGRLATSWTLEGVTTSDDWLLRTQTNGYDAVGNLVSQRYELDGEDAYYNAEYWVWVGQGPQPQLPPFMDPENPEYGWEYHPAESGVAIIDSVLQNATATYDALGRLTAWNETGDDVPAASTTYKYDAQGNIRHTSSSFYELNSFGAPSSSPVTRNNWYRFDALNRVVTSEGVFQGTLGSGSIVRGSQGMDIFYDTAGQRSYSLRTDASSVITREDYTYDSDGRLTQVRSGSSASSQGVIVGRYGYDTLGRLAWQKDYTGTGYQGGESGTNLVYHRTNTWNEKSQITTDVGITKRGSDTYQATSTYTYDQGSSATYALGSPLKITTQNWKNGSGQATSETTNTYAWYDGAVTSSVLYMLDVSQGTTQATPYTYEIIGGRAQLTKVQIPSVPGLAAQTVHYANDLTGQVLSRTNGNGGGAPHEYFYRFGGKEMGHITNNGTLETSYNTSIADRTAVQPTSPGLFHNGATSGTAHGAFAEGVDPVTTYDQGSASGTYTVRGGETLGSIAGNLWGDASLWYKLADANGLAGQPALIAGQTLRLPAGVMRSTHNASTFKPYDPAQALGELGPASPKPQNRKGCGAMGAILMAVIAVVVVATLQPHLAAFFSGGQGTLTALGAQAASGALGTTAAATSASVTAASIGAGYYTVGTAAGFAAGAVAGAAASAASQFAGMAMGMQEKFSWNAIGIAAISGGIGGTGSKLGVGGTGPWSTGARAMISNAATQGLASLTGMQKDFSWNAVATAGIGAAAGNYVAGTAPGAVGYDKQGNLHTKPTLLNVTLSGGASAIANAAARSLMDGSDFGDNVIAALPDVIGSAIGQLVTGQASLERKRAEPLAPSATEASRDQSSNIDPYSREARILAYLQANPSLTAEEFVEKVRQDIDAWEMASAAFAEADGDLTKARAILAQRVVDDYRQSRAADLADRPSINPDDFVLDPARVYHTKGPGGQDGSELLQSVPWDVEHDWYNPIFLDSFGYRQEMADGSVVWRENAEVMARVKRGTDRLNREAAFFSLSIAGGAAGGALVAPALTALGLTGWGAFGTGALADGVIYGVSNQGMRYGAGSEVSLETLGWDTAFGIGGSGVVRGIFATPGLIRNHSASELAARSESNLVFDEVLKAWNPSTASGAPRGIVVPGSPYNVSTAGMTAAERQAVVEYAQRTNIWIVENGGATTIQGTAGVLRSQANSSARIERLNAARAGTPYQGQAGHVPDTALTGLPDPPAGWLDMPGRSNSTVGGGLSSRIGQRVDVITVDGKRP